MGKINEEKAKIREKRESLEKDLALAEAATTAQFRNVSAVDISAGIDPEQPGPPLIIERPDAESIHTYCPSCKVEFGDSFGTRRRELLRALHTAEIGDYTDVSDIFARLQFDNSSKRLGCEHGHFVAYAKVTEEVENRLTQQVWKLINYRKKISLALRALEPLKREDESGEPEEVDFT